MNPFTQVESSNGPFAPLEKRRRCRPRKDPKGTDESEFIIGHPVAGFVESYFDDGYMLTVRIGNSTTRLRGVVFKPGHLATITAENDIAPNLQMIRRDDAYFPAEKRGRSRLAKLGIAKPRNATLQGATSGPSVGIRDPSQLAFGDKDVHHIEPLSIIAPDRRFLGSTSNQVPQQNANIQFSGLIEKVEATESTDNDDLSSETWDDESKSSGDNNSGNEAKQETSIVGATLPAKPAPISNYTESQHNGTISNPLFSYGTGRMTQLLQAVQENMKEKQMQSSELQMPSTFKVHFNGLGTSSSHSNT